MLVFLFFFFVFSHTIGGLSFMSQDLVLFWLALGLVTLSEKLLAVKLFVVCLLNNIKG